MDCANKVALLSCLLIFVGCVDAASFCTITQAESPVNDICFDDDAYVLNCNFYFTKPLEQTTLICSNGNVSDGIDTCMDLMIEVFLLNTSYACITNTSADLQTCHITNFTCTATTETTLTTLPMMTPTVSTTPGGAPVIETALTTLPMMAPTVSTTSDRDPAIETTLTTLPMMTPTVSTTPGGAPVIETTLTTLPMMAPTVSTTSNRDPATETTLTTLPMMAPTVSTTSNRDPATETTLTTLPMTTPTVSTISDGAPATEATSISPPMTTLTDSTTSTADREPTDDTTITVMSHLQTGDTSTTVSTDNIPVAATNPLTMVLWIVLGCLVALIIITLGAIFLVSVAHYRRYKRKKQPTALDVLSKWEDTPNESSDIQLVSMKTIEDSEDEDGEEQKDGGVEDKEAGKEDLDGKADKGEIKQVSKEDDVTVGTFGFAEKVAESTASTSETPTTLIESEKNKEDQSKKDKVAKEEKNEKVVEVTIEKAGEESATSMGSGEDPAPDKKSVADTAVPAEKDKAQEETKLQPVPIQVPVIGKQIADEKTPDNENVAETKISEQPETLNSPSSSKDVQATDSVSKEPEPSATITKPQTEEVKTVLVSDKPPTATGGLSLFTNEDMEKALGVAATKDLGQVESTQL